MKIKKAAALAAVLMAVSGCGTDNAAQDTEIIQNTVMTTAGNTETAETQPLEKYIITCSEITQSALSDSSVEHPAVMQVTDEVMLTDVIGYDMSIAEDYSVNVQLISADLFELTVIRVSDENADAVKEMLEERKEYLINQAAFYPSQKKAAEATRISSLNGYHYLICSENSGDIEKLVMTYILRN